MKTVTHVISSPILRTNGITQWITRINHYYKQAGWRVRIITDAITTECPPELVSDVISLHHQLPPQEIGTEGIKFSTHIHQTLKRLIVDHDSDVTYTHSVEAQRACLDLEREHHHVLHTADIIAGCRVSMLSWNMIQREIEYMKSHLCTVQVGTNTLSTILKQKHHITSEVMRYPIPNWQQWPHVQPSVREGVLYMGSDDYRKRPHLACELAEELGEPLTVYTTGDTRSWAPTVQVMRHTGLSVNQRMWQTLRHRVCHIPSESETVCWVAIEQQLQQPVFVRANTSWSESAQELGCFVYSDVNAIRDVLNSTKNTESDVYRDTVLDYLTTAHTQWRGETA